jgi:hypothetical protein
MRLDHVAGLQTTDGDIFTLQSGIGLEQFLKYVRAFDEYVTNTLTSASPTPATVAPTDPPTRPAARHPEVDAP